ncbi:uncharacterized protein MKK02DRAFT_41894 [Dioszegia hungarica]|uniref:Yeast cell wall synthesis Kre9/Knh1-like N-terminal domain-containing protein n=1 Tax=Dioszegia hungarica TaxID=4972 RepID=A0AA38HD76_9TREE|nr:uncharacterized protein MKK02DRAFT_41894 [Dioszegia hungarica]KAI9638867.1 hypothetical protein MKK02DRAFT_41894 [Dioszegia hungarica]
MIFAFLSLLTVAAAIRVTSPSSSTVWASGTSAQTITWEAVSSDPTSFTIQLVNQAGFLSNSPVTIKESQSSSTGSSNSASITYPGGTWPVGTAFQINLVTSTMSNQAILAQSNQFNITNSGAAAVASSSTGMAPTTVSYASAFATVSAPSSVVTVTSTSGSAGDASGGIPNSAASSRSAGEKPAPSAFISLLLAAAAAFGILA